MNNKIIIKEKGIIETNSSSSHSLTLGNKNFIKPGDKEWDINIKDRVLYIPTCDSFGWDFFKFNSLEKKLQYLSALFFYESDISISAQKDIRKLKKYLCSVFDIDNVIFEWVEDYKNDLKEEMKDYSFNPEYSDFFPPVVDHESRYDSKEEILESENTLRSFLFSRDSWVFGGSDSSSAPRGFYKEEKQYTMNGIASIEFPGFGRIDFSIYYPGDISKYIEKEFEYLNIKSNNVDTILNYLIYDKQEKIVYPINKIPKTSYKEVDINIYMEFRAVISYNGDYYCLYTQTGLDFPTSSEQTNWDKAINELHIDFTNNYYSKSNFKTISDNFVKILDSGLVKENIDYKLFKINIKSDEFYII